MVLRGGLRNMLEKELLVWAYGGIVESACHRWRPECGRLKLSEQGAQQ